MKTHGATRATQDEIDKFQRLRKRGYSIAKAAEACGRSRGWGTMQQKKFDLEVERHRKEFPEPKTYDELDGGVQDTLKDFNLFCEVFLCRYPTPWRLDAANRVVEMLLDPSPSPHYVAVNLAPGSGKSTLYTFDLPMWLICGGGAEDPAWGRARRIMLGHRVKRIAKGYSLRLRRAFEHKRPVYDEKQKREADLVIAQAFGRFRPKSSVGEESLWRDDEFLVAQIGGLEVYQKEPTVQAASRESGFLGTRCDFYSWDDLVVTENSSSAENVESLARWFEDEAESRLEPGGVGLLVGQRLSPIDLFRNRLDQTWIDDDGIEHDRYQHIIYPAHFDDRCDGDHRQWDGANEGCLLDERRLPWGRLLQAQSSPNFRTVYMQEDSDPANVLVQRAWLDGGTDVDDFMAIGCYDSDRGFFEWPAGKLIDYVCVDPSVTNYWVIEWWAYDPETKVRYLIYGERRRMNPGGHNGFLDWDENDKRHVGRMEELQQLSGELGHPIRAWIVEQNAAHRYLFRMNHFSTWRRKWARVKVFEHMTQRNKGDRSYGVRALLTMPYKQGLKRLPRKKGDLEALTYVNQKIRELTSWPHARTDDTVMADWFGEYNLRRVETTGAEFARSNVDPDDQLPRRLQGRGDVPERLQRRAAGGF